MDQLIELLQQIQDLAGTAIEALQGAMSDAGGEAPAEGAPAEAPPEGAPPA
jgi:hypothetical protein